MATQRGLYKMYIADEVTIRDLDDNYIAETDSIEMALRIVDLLTEQDLTKKANYLKGTETIDELLEECEKKRGVVTKAFERTLFYKEGETT